MLEYRKECASLNIAHASPTACHLSIHWVIFAFNLAFDLAFIHIDASLEATADTLSAISVVQSLLMSASAFAFSRTIPWVLSPKKRRWTLCDNLQSLFSPGHFSSHSYLFGLLLRGGVYRSEAKLRLQRYRCCLHDVLVTRAPSVPCALGFFFGCRGLYT